MSGSNAALASALVALAFGAGGFGGGFGDGTTFRERWSTYLTYLAGTLPRALHEKGHGGMGGARGWKPSWAPGLKQGFKFSLWGSMGGPGGRHEANFQWANEDFGHKLCSSSTC
jgi:hypothetical protein